jgi:hypothetical protein
MGYTLEHGGLGPSPTFLENKWTHICVISNEKDAIRVAKLLSNQLGRVRIKGILTQFQNGCAFNPPREPTDLREIESADYNDPELCPVFRFSNDDDY